MKRTRDIMGMPITIETTDPATPDILDIAFRYFEYVDQKFSTYKETSEITRINKNLLAPSEYSTDMQEVLALSEKTKRETFGYFDIKTREGTLDPSGLVKGWAIYNAAKILKNEGLVNFYIDAGGDVEVSGMYDGTQPWKIGVRNPFGNDRSDIIKVVILKDAGIATSGIYIRGEHIYNPKNNYAVIPDIVSLSVIGPNVYEADRFATAAFAMGRAGINFIEGLEGFEGYMIDTAGIATMTSGFKKYTLTGTDRKPAREIG